MQSKHRQINISIQFLNVYVHDGYVALAERLNKIMPCKGDTMKTYFANSGAECDENAIKIAKAYTKRNGVICFTGAFHGRTNLTMALTAKKPMQLAWDLSHQAFTVHHILICTVHRKDTLRKRQFSIILMS